MAITLKPHQKEALAKLGDGKILHGNVGSGKSYVSMAYYVKHHSKKDLYVITTPKKRDSLDWEEDGLHYRLNKNPKLTPYGTMTVDSWNNIKKYVDVKDAFFIFDEQRLVGSGAWVKAFLKINRNNKWIMLSGTPGDVWLDYLPVFIANGFYPNKTEFARRHIVYAPYVKFPLVQRYIDEQHLIKLRKQILVEMPFTRHTIRNIIDVDVGYNTEEMRRVSKERWNLYTNKPCKNVSELCMTERRVAYSDPARIEALLKLMKKHPKLIVFYNYNFEREMLLELSSKVSVAQWNGYAHEDIPSTDRWLYIVQYNSGAEGWNCIETDAMVFMSLPYSWKFYEQAQGRIDRLNTPFKDLYYYRLVSDSKIDRAVKSTLKAKKNFNARDYGGKW